MTKTAVRVIGVHPVLPSAEIFEDTLEAQWGAELDPEEREEAEQRTREHFANLFLVEVQGSALSDDFDWGEVTQELPGKPRENWQAPYDEQAVEGRNTWAFFFHFLDPNRPLRTPDGPVQLPAATPLPAHLSNIDYQAP